ncbi:unnamed protein product [Didymodactylos carnosus]|uniref:Uncharacterized protein n=1 Tax=Didymodactylos carnosus TaxID=1234261 RepID=A0A814NFP6_9BILA|nr:unnamed protein product [Didymodactylos carnosus]CAF3857103.1 unnamed protein product [Didymodactylos carnosus]
MSDSISPIFSRHLPPPTMSHFFLLLATFLPLQITPFKCTSGKHVTLRVTAQVKQRINSNAKVLALVLVNANINPPPLVRSDVGM